MKHSKHPQPIRRIADIIRRLYTYERLRSSDLAVEYSVSTKTITRDFEKISSVIPLERKRGVWRLDGVKLSDQHKLPSAMIQAFASNAGLDIICARSDTRSIPLISFAIAYDSIPSEIAEGIIESIEIGRQCTFDYTNNDGISSRKRVSPAKLHTAKGKWYLIAKDHAKGSIRSYDFYKIKNFKLLTEPSELSQAELTHAQNRASIWSSDTEPFGVTLSISSYARHYIDEMPLHQTQKLLAPHTDNSAEYTYTITRPMELLPAIKEWIPHIHIIEPVSMREDLRGEVERYLEDIRYLDR